MATLTTARREQPSRSEARVRDALSAGLVQIDEALQHPTMGADAQLLRFLQRQLRQASQELNALLSSG